MVVRKYKICIGLFYIFNLGNINKACYKGYYCLKYCYEIIMYCK
jgi:hypothetical protein